jgi:hypothetical protein
MTPASGLLRFLSYKKGLGKEIKRDTMCLRGRHVVEVVMFAWITARCVEHFPTNCVRVEVNDNASQVESKGPSA